MNPSKAAKIFVGCGAGFAVYVCYALVRMTDHLVSWQTVIAAAAIAGVLLCAWGFWQSKPWALGLSFFLALAALGLGAYLIHFAWTFWIFEEPTFKDRILSVLHPRVIIFLLAPALWLFYFTRPAVWQQFIGK